MDRIAQHRYVAIVRSSSEHRASEVVEALIDGGAGAIEVTMTTPGALRLVERFAGDVLIGVGTVLSGGQVAAAAEAGARFVVTPNLEPDVIRHAGRHGLAALIGCSTPTEVVHALELGADAIKLFPAAGLGPAHLRALSAPLPWAPMVPTGGVSLDNASDWFDAGAVALGVGGSLTEGVPAEISARAAAWCAAVRQDATPVGEEEQR